MAKKLYKPNEVEMFTLKLDEKRFPIAFRTKVEELVESGLSEEEARKCVSEMEFDLEVYVEKGVGLFCVETDICECDSIYSPYTKDLYEENND